MINDASKLSYNTKLKSSSIPHLPTQLQHSKKTMDNSSNLEVFKQQHTNSSLTDSNENYMQPVIDNSTPLPFPIPKNGDNVKSRTDENLSLLSKQLPKNIYKNTSHMLFAN